MRIMWEFCAFFVVEVVVWSGSRDTQSGEDELSRKTRLSLNLHLLRPHHCPTISPRPPIALICLFFSAREAFSGSFRLLLIVFRSRSPSHSQNGQAHLHDRHPDQAPQRSAGALHSLILLFRLLDGRAGCVHDIAKMDITVDSATQKG